MRLSYDVELSTGVQKRELPFVIGVLGDLSGQPRDPLPPMRERRFVEISADTLDDVLDSARPRVAFRLDSELAEGGIAIDLQFRSLADFEPENVAGQVSELRDLLDLRGEIHNLQVHAGADVRVDTVIQRCLTDGELLRRVHAELGAEAGPVYHEVAALLAACGLKDDAWVEWTERGTAHRLTRMLSYAAAHPFPHSRDAGAMMQAGIDGIDRIVARHLDAMYHHPGFKALEACWRGIAYLCDRTRDLPSVKLKVLNITKREALRDLRVAPEFDQSNLFKAIYGEYETLGGEPMGLLVGVYQIQRHPDDMEMLQQISYVAAAASCLFLAAADPALLQLESFRDLEIPRSLTNIFDSTEYAKWRWFRRSVDSRYVALVLPRILLRAPFHAAPEDARFFPYGEQIQSPDDLLWGNPAFALAANFAEGAAMADFSQVVVGAESGGLVSGLPMWHAVSDEGEDLPACPTEIGITDRRQQELSKLGFIALCHRKHSDEAVFFDLPSCCQPLTVKGREEMSRQSYLSTKLENIVFVSRFAHYLKCIMRDKFGKAARLSDWERLLDEWIKRYVVREEMPAAEEPAPLLSGGVRLERAPDYHRPYLVATMRPRFANGASDAVLRVTLSLPQMREVPE